MNPKQRRKAVTLSIDEDVMAAARSLHINASQAAEAGIKSAVLKQNMDAWHRENAEAIQAYNEDVETNGMVFQPLWLRPWP